MVWLSRSRAFRYSLGIFIAWLCAVSFIFIQVTNMRTVVDAIEEIGNKIEEVHASFTYDREQRIQRQDEISLDIQLIYALRIQLQANYVDSLFAPDISQFLHSTDRYLDSVNAMLEIESELSALVSEIRDQRNQYARNEGLLLFALLGSYVSEATLSSSIRIAAVFKDIDDLVLTSASLPDEQRVPFQKLLAQTAIVLGRNAEINHLVHQISNHEVYNQQSWLEEQYHRLVYRAMAMVVISSLLGFLGLLGLLLGSKQTEENGNKIAASAKRENNTDSASRTDSLLPMADLAQTTPLPAEREPLAQSHTESLAKEPASLLPINVDLMMDSLSGDKESVLLLLKVFVQDHSNEHRHFLEAMQTDRESAQRIVHSLKGVAASLGANELKVVSMEIEMAMKEGSEPTEQQLETLKSSLAKTIEYAQQLINGNVAIH
ncbi:Hpt domain-containing protein [Vibrio sp. 05-20-BW147]|uniref:Hpt domain-containing protein n=1 Tax=Vibrio sp. 05-20-BW147 TaxID=2575834 RepID=UPI0015949775|nr:Hpt domain-containing protein [Vibrio sp. 05-20-BW147]NVC63630.1 Hpt domain-containing protein [Vibrio sp. 05-20-BW147]